MKQELHKKDTHIKYLYGIIDSLENKISKLKKVNKQQRKKMRVIETALNNFKFSKY